MSESKATAGGEGARISTLIWLAAGGPCTLFWSLPVNGQIACPFISHLPCRQIFLSWQLLSLLRPSPASIYSSLLKELPASSFDSSTFYLQRTPNFVMLFTCWKHFIASPYHLGQSSNSLMYLWGSLWSDPCLLSPNLFSYSSLLTLWLNSITSPNVPFLWPLGLCTCCSLCMENYSSSLAHLCFHTCFSDLTWEFLQDPLILKSRWGAPPYALSHLCVPLL